MMRITRSLCALLAIAIATSSLCLCQSQETTTEYGADDANPVTATTIQHKAEAGDRNAQNQLGLMAQAEQDYHEALKWFQLASNQGLSDAQVNLALLYTRGLGTEKDFAKAAHLYTLAAAQHNVDGEFDLGVCYLNGEGVEQNSTLARKWMALALAHGDGGRSANGLGLTYETGPQANRDYAEAFSWYSKAADMGYAESQYNVCRLTAQGFVTPADYAGSIKWCSVLAERGDEWGEYGMAQILENGTGGPVNLEEAAKWYEKSAEQGNFGAQFSLGTFYAEGKGVKRDLSEAYMWIALAGSGRHPDALAYLENLTAKMSPSQLSTGQTLARKWLQDHPRDPEKNFDHIVYKPD